MPDKFQQKVQRVVSEIEEELRNIERLLSELNEHQKEDPRNTQRSGKIQKGDTGIY